jgi:SAM-dependent methyltransferase
MDRAELYDRMAERKFKPKDLEPYDGNNGRVNRAASFIRRGFLRSGGRLLDVGGGIGDLGHSVRDLFETRVVLDISKKNLEAAEAKGNQTICADVDREGIPSPSCYYDLVVALDFIEHIVDPVKFAWECARVLKPSGEVFINTSNIRFWRHIEQLWKGGRFPHTSGDRDVYHGGHLAFFTYLDLREIFESARPSLGGPAFSSIEQFKDEEGYENPPDEWISALRPKNQDEYRRLCLELGCPNLLYKAIVTK